MIFTPVFHISPRLVQILMDIETSRQAVDALPITLPLLTALRETARLLSTHYSTQIEGNRLSQEQVSAVLAGQTFPNRVRDEHEVKHYYRALEQLDTLLTQKSFISERELQLLHGLVMYGKAKASPYRDGQNIIRDSLTGRIVYLPPEAHDVAPLMQALWDWLEQQEQHRQLPSPLVAAIAHYQYATIHPYYDGNGRTARLLSNYLLHRSGYGLKGIYTLEAYYAQDLASYYAALNVGSSHNYYFGRAEADISHWLEYFCTGMAEAFSKVRAQASSMQAAFSEDKSKLLRQLDQRQQRVLSLFQMQQYITSRDIAITLRIGQRHALNLCNRWLEADFLVRQGRGRSTRYSLAARWQQLL